MQKQNESTDVASSLGQFWITNNSHMTNTTSDVATQASSRLSNTLNFPKHPIPLQPPAYLKLCDSSVTDLSTRGCIFTSIESFHFVIQLTDKVYLQRSRACGGVKRESCTVHSASTEGENLLFFNTKDHRAVTTNSRANSSPVLPFCRVLGNDRVTFSSSF